jgi:chromate reductase, NAD(P)H dehydrogenase (quinone)
MILVISGTNRPGSSTKIIADHVHTYLEQNAHEPVKFLDLQDLPLEMFRHDFYESDGMPEELKRIQDELLIPATSWVIISPEYNGSFPGILKSFIDAVSIRKYKQTFAYKKAALIGVSDGRAGNIRGMDHLTGFLNYLKFTIFFDKLPLSNITMSIEDGRLKEDAAKSLNNYLTSYLQWTNIIELAV